MEQTDYEVRRDDLLAAVVRLGKLANEYNLAASLGATVYETRSAIISARTNRLLATTYNRALPFGKRDVQTLTERGWRALRDAGVTP